LKYLLPNYSSVASGQTGFFISNFVREIRAGKVDDFLRRLSSLFADTPYELIKDLENHYQNVMFIVGKLMGLYVNAEYHTSQGRIDLVIQTSDYVYVMEFKLDGTAEEAIAQINDKGYARQFAADSRHLLKIGVNFSATTRNIERWIVE
jgi:ATP-dependent exoDNAse (exonuclease V) beta subunit